MFSILLKYVNNFDRKGKKRATQQEKELIQSSVFWLERSQLSNEYMKITHEKSRNYELKIKHGNTSYPSV